VIIDIFYDMVKPSVKRWLTVVNYVIVLIVDLVFTFYAWKYTKMAGIQISQGMEIPMYYMYGIMPVSGVLCAVCTVIKIREFIEAPLSRFAPHNAEVKPEDALLNQQKGDQ
jgi:C4-dicarboxylate transporter DctQ subunit